MADTVEQPTAPAASDAAAAPAPVVETPAAPAASPITENPVQAAPDAPAPDSGASLEPGAERPPQREPEPTLLDKFDAEHAPKPEETKVEAKPEEKPADAAEPKPAEAEKAPDAVAEAEKPAEEVKEPEAPPPVEVKPFEVAELFTPELVIPETITLNDEAKAEIATLMSTFRGDPKKGMQGLLDYHNREMTAFADRVGKGQWDTWNQTREGWRNQVMADPKLGGSGYQTAMATVARMRDKLVSDAQPGTPQYETDMSELKTFLKVTGAGDHPSFLRILRNAGQFLDEPRPAPSNPKPPPNQGVRPGSRREILYDKTPPAQR